MSVKVGSVDLVRAYEGSNEIDKIYVGSVEVYNNSGGSQLFLTSAAALSPNEANDTTGWAVGADITLVSQNTDVQDGSFALEATYGVDAGTTSKRISYDVTVEVGETYEVTFWAKSTGTDSRSYLWTGVTGEVTRTFTGTWTQYTETVVADSTTMQMRFFPAATGTGHTGVVMHVDGISVIKTS